ncbi:uncharacterized protein LOC129601705 [Paramacrobiotus metropolitanus]|uniref:uncharacterized protein LOC129601705 n=1 Tax=Paramacrobiotus metropolitanus TaxID=2943436 RepID=UPI002445B24A|nr:uncharacterized protein LOC129601705 [Paramacrobiotus metropolitanus]
MITAAQFRWCFDLVPKHWRKALPSERLDAEVKIDVHAARLPLDGDFACALLDALDAALPIPSAQELQNLQQRLKARGKEEEDLKAVVCKMLCAVQSCDPRPSAHYRGKNWRLNGLGNLQLEKLSRVTLHFLVEAQKKIAQKGRCPMR